MSVESLQTQTLDSANWFNVRSKNDHILFDSWPFKIGSLSRNEALNLAAWLSAIADPTGRDVSRLVNEIKRVPTATTPTQDPCEIKTPTT